MTVSTVDGFSALSTPTISTMCMSESSIDALSDVGSYSAEHEVNDDPTFFFREDMIVVRVHNTRFRIPRFFLTRNSTHFSDLLVDKANEYELIINDIDVSSLGFSSLLSLIHPLDYGATSMLDLSQWSQVLHLSDKWGFSAIRAAAIKAIFPLASSVDKIVLGRKYGFDDWLPTAFEELLVREGDLTEAEGEMLGMRTVIALASGRARTHIPGKLKSKTKIQVLVHEVAAGLHTGPHETIHGNGSALATPHAMDVSTDDITTRNITQWMAEARNDTERTIAANRIIDYVYEFPARRSAAFTILVQRSHLHSNVCFPGNTVGQWMDYLSIENGGTYIWDTLKHGLTLEVFFTNIRSAWTSAINDWSLLENFNEDYESLSALGKREWRLETFTTCSENLKILVYNTRLMRQLIDDDSAVQDAISKSIFVAFWHRMDGLLQHLPSAPWPPLLPEEFHWIRALTRLIAVFGPSVVTDAASVEMDEFFDHVRQAQATAQSVGDQNSVRLYEEMLSTRRYCWTDV